MEGHSKVLYKQSTTDINTWQVSRDHERSLVERSDKTTQLRAKQTF